MEEIKAKSTTGQLLELPLRQTMACALIVAPRSLRLVRLPVPEPQQNEVLLKIEGCGVCGSDIDLWEGRTAGIEYPLGNGRPGHEPWGRVAAVGPGVTGLSEGEPVAALSYNAFAEYDLALAEHVVRLPDGADGHAFPGEALACALNVFRYSKIEAGQNVAIVGIGFLGAVIAQLAVRAGANVIAISRRPFALEVARGAGVRAAVRLDGDTVDAVREVTGGPLCDTVIEAAGVQESLDLSGELTRQEGRLVIAGYHQGRRRRVSMQMWNWRAFEIVNAHFRSRQVLRQGLLEAVEAVASGVLKVDHLYTHSFGLPRLEYAFELARTRPDGFLKCVIRS